MKRYLPKLALLAALAPVACLGCEEQKPLVDDSRLVRSARTSKPELSASAAAPKVMPYIELDADGIHIGGLLYVPDDKPAQTKLKDRVAKLPIREKPVTLVVKTKAKTPHVALLIDYLADKGAPRVVIKTSGRATLPKEITVVPESLVKEAQGCSLVASVLESMDIGVWSISGGGGTRHRKGLAGPDLSAATESIEEGLGECKARTAFFSGHPSHRWEVVYNLGAAIAHADKDGKIDKLVLLGKEPAAGRPVELGE